MQEIELLKAGETVCLIGCRVTADRTSIFCRAAWINAGDSKQITLRKVDRTPFLKMLIPEEIQGQGGILLGDGGGDLIEFDAIPLGA